MEKFSGRFLSVVDEIVKAYPVYMKEAYCFVYEAWSFANKELSKRENQHLSGFDLVYNGITPLALNRWNVLAGNVLSYWGIHEGKDLGKIVELLVKFGVFCKSKNDHFEDFETIDLEALLENVHER